jgi:hypothetical protein
MTRNDQWRWIAALVVPTMITSIFIIASELLGRKMGYYGLLLSLAAGIAFISSTSHTTMVRFLASIVYLPFATAWVFMYHLLFVCVAFRRCLAA